MARLVAQQLDTWLVAPQKACLSAEPSWEGISGGMVFLLALLDYSVFQLLIGKKEKKKKEISSRDLS